MGNGMNEDWLRIISRGETMHIDFKGALEWAGPGRAAVARDVVAMANIRDGGMLLIGVAEGPDGSGTVEGLTPQQAATFDPTSVGEYVASYFQPPVNISIERPLVAGVQLVAIRVAEFDASPIICTKDGPEEPNTGGKARRYFYGGNLIVRNAAAKSEVIRTAEDMHALIRVSVTKTSNQLLADVRRILEGGAPPLPVLPHERELAQWSKTLPSLREKWSKAMPGQATFTMTFLPSEIGRVLTHDELRRLVKQSQVTWGGWVVPSQTYEDRSTTIQNRAFAVEGTTDSEEYQESWQLHGSGAFMFARLLHYVDRKTAPRIPFEDVVYGVALGLHFAQRLYQELVPDGQVELEFSLLGTQGQRLGTFEKFMRRMPDNFRSGEDVITSRTTVSVLDLRSAWREVVHRVLRELFALFNWSIESRAIDPLLDQLEGKPRR
jgi:hypothetical protein